MTNKHKTTKELDQDTKKEKPRLKRMWVNGVSTTITGITFFVAMTYLTKTCLVKNAKDLLFAAFIFIILPTIVGYMKERRNIK